MVLNALLPRLENCFFADGDILNFRRMRTRWRDEHLATWKATTQKQNVVSRRVRAQLGCEIKR